MDLFSTPFDFTAVDFLEKMEVPAYKIASFELVDIPLIQRCAATGKPLIMSTGMATEQEIREAIAAARGAGCRDLALLKCTSAYPSAAADMNLRTIPDMISRFCTVVGLSDHTLDLAVPIASVALGGRVIEKHLTMSRLSPGPDSAFSLEPHEFKAMVQAVRTTQEALGQAQYQPGPKELGMRIYRRSLFAASDIAEGEEFTPQNVRSIRPADGLHTRYYNDIIGKRAATSIAFGTPLREEHLSSPLAISTAQESKEANA